MSKLIAALAIMGLLAAACGADDAGGSGNQPDTTQAPPTTQPAPSEPTPTLEPAPVDSTEPTPPRTTEPETSVLPAAAAVSDLTTRLGASASAIRVEALESVTWRDGSLGCPQPGMNYTQALVPGIRVILEYDGELFYYHGTGPDDLFYCENPTDPLPGDPGDA